MAVGMLRDDLLSLPGVESADLDGDEMAPSGVRVRLAPGTDVATVGEEVRRVLALHGLRSEVGVEPASPDGSPRAASGPPATGDAPVRTLEKIRVDEGRDGVVVEAFAGDETAEMRAAGRSEPALDQAVVGAVAAVAGAPSVPLIRSVDVRELGGTRVVTVMIDENGDRLVGSAVFEGGRAYAVGRAVWAALSSR